MGKKTSKPSKPANKGGRPSIYSEELGKSICARLCARESLRSICKEEGMPSEATVYNWLLDMDKPEFLENYTRARGIQIEMHAEEILEISDDASNDWTERTNADGSSYAVVDHDHISRSRLMVDTRKWLMAKMLPKKYGDKITQEHSGPNGSPLVPALSDFEVARRLAFVFKAGEQTLIDRGLLDGEKKS